MSEIHARPIEEVNEIVKGNSIERGDAVVIPEVEVPASPGIHHLTKGTTYLANQLRVKDNEKTKLLNDFVLHRMKDEGLQDTPKAYNSVLRGILKGLGLTTAHELDAIMERLRNAYDTKDLKARDYLILRELMHG